MIISHQRMLTTARTLVSPEPWRSTAFVVAGPEFAAGSSKSSVWHGRGANNCHKTEAAMVFPAIFVEIFLASWSSVGKGSPKQNRHVKRSVGLALRETARATLFWSLPLMAVFVATSLLWARGSFLSAFVAWRLLCLLVPKHAWNRALDVCEAQNELRQIP
jgi:hypothetical protein